MASTTATRRGKRASTQIDPKLGTRQEGTADGLSRALLHPTIQPVVVQVQTSRDLRQFAPQHKLPNGQRCGLGWLRDLPDFRDGTIRLPPKAGAQDNGTQERRQLHEKALRGVVRRSSDPASLAPQIDNRQFCSPIEDQEQLGSCTAQACVGLVEYMERRASGRHIEGSRLFLYKTTRKLMGWDGDTGAFLRSTMKALVHFGLPPEEWWPYDISTFENEPDPFLYAYALSCKAIQYFRLDPAGTPEDEALNNIKSVIDAGYATMFGFSVYDSLDNQPDIPFPRPTDRQIGGHAVLCVGYDENRSCRNTTSKGAMLIRNSWGTGWGDQGYGWLPFEYVTRGLANDFWTCYQVEWVDSHQFE